MSVETYESPREAEEILVETLIMKGEQALRDLREIEAEDLLYNRLENVEENDNSFNVKLGT